MHALNWLHGKQVNGKGWMDTEHGKRGRRKALRGARQGHERKEGALAERAREAPGGHRMYTRDAGKGVLVYAQGFQG